MTSARKEPDVKLSRSAQRLAARRAAALAGHSGDAAAARRALDDPHPEVRATALRSLARLGETTERTISEAARDPDPLVRAAACELAPELSGPHGVAILEPRLEDVDATVTEAAAFAAGEIGDAAAALVPGVTALLDHDDPIVRETAVAALGAIGDRSALPAILAATKDRATVRRRAIIALAPFEGSEVEAALMSARSDRDWQVRQAAEDQTEPTEETTHE